MSDACMSNIVGVVDNNLGICRAPTPEELKANQPASNTEFIYESDKNSSSRYIAPSSSSRMLQRLDPWSSYALIHSAGTARDLECARMRLNPKQFWSERMSDLAKGRKVPALFCRF
jgi:hypothetical protein